jgi:hypothetical protein
MGGKIRTADAHHLASGFSYSLSQVAGSEHTHKLLQGDAAFDSVRDNNL